MSQKKIKSSGERCFCAQIRAATEEENERKFIISFSSEEPYLRWFGPEILSHEEGAMDLGRLNEMGVLLFNHHRDQVVGKVLRAWIENGRGMAEVEFDDDEFSETIRKKVASGTLKGVSVSYRVSVWEEVEAGATSSNGKHVGPCSIAKKWEAFEISIATVPADPSVGVGRSLEEMELKMWHMERQLEINRNYL
ncbi:HK97 family phage prohead protease [Anaerotignum propionicum]|uniref:Caudovirus prohead protease n=1 Tax=Anaerotignum propionicum DSM 1682 TaxID=991789 RepID=A0A0X1U7R2_ANAPI|nr:HK97 family phage prohead protease [Anaerotignum propionicum]AMJ40979.1 caudovirus prohead protease [Anaerotignum propionicum DSM 1682]SHE60322.1 prohead serine protease [[Clostridium] propionicum DSM 1682] [Anaerotignum propionicum DSM 1682]